MPFCVFWLTLKELHGVLSKHPTVRRWNYQGWRSRNWSRGPSSTAVPTKRLLVRWLFWWKVQMFDGELGEGVWHREKRVSETGYCCDWFYIVYQVIKHRIILHLISFLRPTTPANNTFAWHEFITALGHKLFDHLNTKLQYLGTWVV